MDDGSIFMIVALIILIGLSAFFSAAETAYNSLNEIRLRSKAEDGDARAAHTLALVERYDSLLSTILIGNNIVNIGASSLATVLFTRLVGGVYGPTVSTIVMTLLVLTFGEITPKSMAKEMPETLAMSFAPVLSALVTIFTPLNALFGAWKKFLAKRFDTGEKDTITEGELVTMVSEAEKDGELTNRESELIRSAIEFDDVEAQDVLTPRVDVVAVEDDTPMDEVIERFAESGVRPDVVVVDPPRKGLNADTIEALHRMSPRRIVYVSCDPATLARDLKRFVEEGTFSPVKITPVDLFPQTFHCETVVHLRRN